MSGKLIGVGVGPGDPELITLKAFRLIQNARVLAYTVDSNGFSYARQTAAACIPHDNLTELPLRFSMSPLRAQRLQAREYVTQQVFNLLEQNRDVVFITEGDPLLYSTFQHLLTALPAEIQIEICPGISAMNGAAAAARFSLASENECLKIAPAETAISRLQDWLQEGDSIVLYKVARHIRQIREQLLSSGLSFSAVFVERASTHQQVIHTTLADWPEEDIPYFSIILIRPDQANLEN